MKEDTKRYRDMFSGFSGKYLKEIDGFVRDFYRKKIESSEEEFMKEMYGSISEYCLRDGKRIRPLLVLASFHGYRRGFSGTGEIVKLAASIEMMHSFLLIQDDIIDRSEMRRGGKSLHILMGEMYGARTDNRLIGSDIAIVLADVIFANVMEIISQCRINLKVKNSFLEIFSRTYEKTAWGQILDSMNSMLRKIEKGNDSPAKIGLMKTAYYTIAYPVMMGYVLSGRSSAREFDAIEKFALPLGVAFQVRDDILGVFGVESDTGKPTDSDILEGKYTLLIQEAVRIMDEKEGAAFLKLLLKQKKSARDVVKIRNTIEKTGALDSAIRKHAELIDESRENLQNLSVSKKYREILQGVLEAVATIPLL